MQTPAPVLAKEAVARQLPTLLLDKSVFQRIAELPKSEREQCWARLRSKYLLVVPNVLVEEILVNWGDPGATLPAVVNAMVEDVLLLHGYWLADETDWAYHELVLTKRTYNFIEAPRDFIERVSNYEPTSPAYQKFLSERKAEAKRDLEQRLRLQQEAASGAPSQKFITDEHGRHFVLVDSERTFFGEFVASQAHLRDKYPHLWFEYLNNLFGAPLRSRYSNQEAAIDSGLRSIRTQRQFFECVGTFNIGVAKSCYFWAPLTKVGKDSKTAKVILGRNAASQKGNIHDERYLAAAMLCGALVTRDGEMARMAELFQRLGLWAGKLFHSPAGDVRTQLEHLIASY